MKLNALLVASATVLLTFIPVGGSLLNAAHANSPAAAVIAQTIKPTFVKGEAPTEGSYTIVTEGDKRYLVLSDEFKTGKGPDLQVVLHRVEITPAKDYKAGDYVNLGKLQKLNGTQRYEIPAEVKLSDYKSVAIWCKKFNVTFGYAPLKG